MFFGSLEPELLEKNKEPEPLGKKVRSCFIFFCSFTLLVCGEKNILPNLTNIQEPEPLGKKIRSQSRSRLKKYQEPETLKNFPQPEISRVMIKNSGTKKLVIFVLF